MEKGLPGPALTLVRPLIESWLRGVWASKGANDQAIADFLKCGQPKPWRPEELAKRVKDLIPTETEWLEKNIIDRPEMMNMLNELTHGGFRQVQYRVGKEAIEPKLPVETQVALLKLGNKIRRKCLTQLCEMMNEGAP